MDLDLPAGPYFGNAASILRLTGRTATVTVEGTNADGGLFEVASVTYPSEMGLRLACRSGRISS